MSKEIIGYKFKEEFSDFKDAFLSIIKNRAMTEWIDGNVRCNVLKGSLAHDSLKKAGVLDLWCEPVYNKEKEIIIDCYHEDMVNFIEKKSKSITYTDKGKIFNINENIYRQLDYSKSNQKTDEIISFEKFIKDNLLVEEWINFIHDKHQLEIGSYYLLIDSYPKFIIKVINNQFDANTLIDFNIQSVHNISINDIYEYGYCIDSDFCILSLNKEKPRTYKKIEKDSKYAKWLDACIESGKYISESEFEEKLKEQNKIKEISIKFHNWYCNLDKDTRQNYSDDKLFDLFEKSNRN